MGLTIAGTGRWDAENLPRPLGKFSVAAMRILLQCVRTRTYVQHAGSWTRIPEQALEFSALIPALDFALRYGMKDVRPVIHWDFSVAELHSSAENTAAPAVL